MRFRELWKTKNGKKIAAVTAAGLLLGGAAAVWETVQPQKLPEYRLEKGKEGSGEREETLEYEVGAEKGTLTLEIPELIYTQEETQQFLQEAAGALEEEMLGKNESLARVQSDLNLPERLDGNPVSISWNTNAAGLVDYEGKLGEEIPEEGAQAVLTAELSLQGETLTFVRNVTVFPPELKNTGEKLLKETREQNREEEARYYYLPKELNGETVTWKKTGTGVGITILFLTAAAAAAMTAAQGREKERENERIQDEMLEDYPEIVSKLLLLLSAGLSLRMSMERVGSDYERKKGSGSGEGRAGRKAGEKTGRRERRAYEEILVTCREMQSGVPELSAYENLGKRCPCPAYRTLATLLTQNLKKGGGGIAAILQREAEDALEERKRRARVKGEKAGTKLLLPMILMLAVVLAVLMVPAYLSFIM